MADPLALFTEWLTATLPVFRPYDGLPESPEDVRRVLCADSVCRVRSFALGPPGTNMILAADRFHFATGIQAKAEVIPCETPEEAVRLTRATYDEGVLAIFWTCAVYFRENEIFFRNPDALPFYFQQLMRLDEMQVARRPAMDPRDSTDALPLRILTHWSPKPLVEAAFGDGVEYIEARSNGEAAARCARGEAEACITTESACRKYGLETLHRFGSPPMVFFGGICQTGATLLRQVFAGQAASGEPEEALRAITAA